MRFLPWLVTGLLMLSASGASGQLKTRFEITPMGGWQFGGSLSAELESQGSGKLKTPAAGAFGVTLDFTVRPDGQVEFLYWRQNTSLRFQLTGSPEETLFDMSVEYFHVGGLLQFEPQTWGYPFAIASLGGTRFNPDEPTLSDEWRFSFALGGGAKLMFTDRIGVRGQARLWMTLLQSDSAFFCALPGGCLISVSGTVLFQGEASAGLVVGF